MRHDCGTNTITSRDPNGTWQICAVCDGRVHMNGCTSKRNPSRDCCEKRHQNLHDKGQTTGLYCSDPMLPW